MGSTIQIWDQIQNSRKNTLRNLGWEIKDKDIVSNYNPKLNQVITIVKFRDKK